jgi:geranylgeranyl diphosphate synthase type II
MTEFDQKLGYYHRMAEESIGVYLPDPELVPRSLLDAMSYSLLGGGKRIRAVLLLAFYEACGGTDTAQALPFAAAVEMIHAYSLIHDDLPCMDDDDIRRGKASCHIVYGEANALLAGDALLTLAFETLSDARCIKSHGAATVAEAVSILAKAAGAGGMVGGQVMDLENEGARVTAEELMLTDRKKTGALIRCAAELGCLLAGADCAVRDAALGYAAKLGLAFQVVDDILDRTGTEDQLGKPVGSDEEQHKSTYISVYGLDRAKEIAATLTAEAISALDKIDGDFHFCTQLVDFLCNRTY